MAFADVRRRGVTEMRGGALTELIHAGNRFMLLEAMLKVMEEA